MHLLNILHLEQLYLSSYVFLLRRHVCGLFSISSYHEIFAGDVVVAGDDVVLTDVAVVIVDDLLIKKG